MKMIMPKEQLAARFKNFKRVCLESGTKLTNQRIAIFHEVSNSNEHPDAERVYKRLRKKMPALSLDTVYRTLWLLMDLRIITTLGAVGERMRFEANILPHHHFICTECGMVMDFYNRTYNEIDIPKEVRAVGRVEHTQIEMKGKCSVCLNRRK